MYKFDFHFSEDDYIAFNIFFSKNLRRKPMKPKFSLIAIILSFALLMFWRLHYMDSPPLAWILPIAFLAFCLFIAIFPACIAKHFAKSGIKSSIASLKAGGGVLPFGHDYEVVCDGDAIVQIAGGVKTSVSYDAVDKIAVGDGTVYLFLNVTQAIIIKASAFENEAQRSEFLAYIKEKTGK